MLGDYVLREKLGDGGFGEVYRAEHLELRRVAVIKVMNEERRWTDDTAAARFRREAQLASQLRHPNAAHVYDFGIAAPEGEDDDEVMWIAMEFVDGVTFADWLEAHGPMSLGEAVQFFEPLLKAVDAAHQCGIVHRDLKPSNVMVVESKDLDSRGVPVPKLIDLGIAKGAVENVAEDEPVDAPSGDEVTTELIRATRSPLYHRTSTNPDRPTFVPEHASYVVGVHYEGDDLVTRGFAGDNARWMLPSPDNVIEACRISSCAGTDTGNGSGSPRVLSYDDEESNAQARIRRETIRVLAELDLVRVAAGGPNEQLMDTEDINRTCVVRANAGNADTKA